MPKLWKDEPPLEDEKSSLWTFIYAHRNPRRLPPGYAPNEAEARQYKGLILTPVYDLIAGNVMWQWWELRHANSAELMFFIKADGDEMAESYATRVAEHANWDHMRTVPAWESPPHAREMIEFLNSTENVFYLPDYEALFPELRDPDLDGDVPYGSKG